MLMYSPQARGRVAFLLLLLLWVVLTNYPRVGGGEAEPPERKVAKTAPPK